MIKQNLEENLIKNILEVLNKNKKYKKHELHEPSFKKKDLIFLENCIKNNHVSALGKYLILFKKKISQILKQKNIILTSTGSSAIHTILKALKIGKKDEILIPNFNYIASANAVLLCNSTPHLVDIEEKTMGIDVEKLDKYLDKISFIKKNYSINKFTKKRIKACIVLHTFGFSSDIIKLKKILNKRKILLIEDAAEALGSFYKRKHLGTFGFAGVLSFNGNKIITSGNGGAIISSNKKFLKNCSHIASNARKRHDYIFSHDQLGFNYKLSNLNAALGYSQINKLKSIIRSKQKLHNLYKKEFLSSINFNFFTDINLTKSNKWLNFILLKENNKNLKNRLIKACIKRKIFVRPGWELMHKINYLKNCPKMDLRNSISIHNRLICLPSSPHYYLEKN